MNDPTGRAGDRARLAIAEFEKVSKAMERRFQEGRRVLSFGEYLELFSSNPARYCRDASRFVRDMFDHFGTRTVDKPWGALTRFRLFDADWARGDEAAGTPETRGQKGREVALVGHEELQAEIYRVLCNFTQEGRANRLMLLHGPNGSAKSTAASCILRALEHYSTLDEGALYRFHWVFPSNKTLRGPIGFGEERRSPTDGSSYAHLRDDEIDARLVIELRDHPLFLLPIEERRTLVGRLFAEAGVSESPPDWLMSGSLSHKNQQVFEALLVANEGSLAETLRHVQVERYFISRRYRTGAVTLGPELSVDAGERQITSDRSLSALPASLRATTLFEAYGELIDAAGGVIEFSDLLKRPLDTYRYLQLTLETGEVALPQQTVQTNVVMIGSANEVHLNAFREHPEFPSFRGRFELIRAPYLRSYLEEREIYDAQIAPYVTRHVAPHATAVAAQFAALTRMRQPESKRYSAALSDIVASLTALEKIDLYATGATPERLDADARKVLRAGVGEIYRETESAIGFEGSVGVSPREVRTVLFDAAQSPDYACLSPFAVLVELDELCRRTTEYAWLRETALDGGYHDHKQFREAVRARLLDVIEEEMRTASGLVDETKYAELFERYITHVGAWVKGEKLRNPVTGASEAADERMMREVEGFLGVTSDNEAHRSGLISAVAAWAIDHPGEKIVRAVVFSQSLKKLRETVFAERRKPVAMLVRDLVGVLRDRLGGTESRRLADGLGEEQRDNALAALERLRGMGYCDHCALDAASSVLRFRFAEIAG